VCVDISKAINDDGGEIAMGAVWEAEASDVNADKEAEAMADEALAENADVPADVMATAEDMYGGDWKSSATATAA
jgi:hypothetical protein